MGSSASLETVLGHFTSLYQPRTCITMQQSQIYCGMQDALNGGSDASTGVSDTLHAVKEHAASVVSAESCSLAGASPGLAMPA